MGIPNTNALYYGDCLDWMGQWDDNTVDMIYLDPPFNSKSDYNMLYKDEAAGKAQTRAFTDTWTWDAQAKHRQDLFAGAIGLRSSDAITGLHHVLGNSGMMSYLSYMALRLEPMHRLLKSSGSIYLHCDPTASHYLKVVMDAIFGTRNFRNEIVWHYRTYQGRVDQYYPKKHDVIFWYTKDRKRFEERDTFTLEYQDNYKDTVDYKRWKKFYVKVNGKRNQIQFKNYPKTDSRFTQYLDRWIEKNGRQPDPDDFIFQCNGYVIDDVWMDVQALDPKDKTERLGYPTQKPIDLLNRIIKQSTKEGDIVLDPFCGCGTTVAACIPLKRQFVGIDISSFAIDLVAKKRLKGYAVTTNGIPFDFHSAQKLAQEKPFDFESWAVTRLPGFVPNTKQVGDGGIDGRATIHQKPEGFRKKLAVAQVKGGKNPAINMVRAFRTSMTDAGAALGYYITLEPVQSAGFRKEVAAMDTVNIGGNTFERLQNWPIAQYFNGRQMPPLPTMNDPYTNKPIHPSFWDMMIDSTH